MVLPQPKYHQPASQEIKAYDLVQAQLGNKALLDRLANLAILDGVLVEDEDLDYTIVNLVEHKLGRKYRGFIVIRRQVPPCAFSAQLNGNQSINSGGGNAMALAQEDYDYGGDFNNSTYRFVAPIDGFYFFEAGGDLSGLADGAIMLVFLRKNGATNVSQQRESNGAALDVVIQLGTILPLVKDDYIECWVDHNHGVARTLLDDTATYFRGRLVDNGISEDKDWLDVATNDPTRFLPLRCSFDQTVSLWIF